MRDLKDIEIAMALAGKTIPFTPEDTEEQSATARLWEIDPEDLEATDAELLSEDDMYVLDLIEWVKR